MVFIQSTLKIIGATWFLLPLQIIAFRSSNSCSLNGAASISNDVSRFSTLSTTDATVKIDTEPVDRRPYEQRVSASRSARRLNHAFQHLYRHSDPRWDDNDWSDVQWSHDVEFQQNAGQLLGHMDIQSTTTALPLDPAVALSAIHYLNKHGGYCLDEIREMHAAFPPLFEIDVKRHLRPKMRFLKYCLNGVDDALSNNTDEDRQSQILDPKLKAVLPASFFGARFERTIAPRHAFLVHVNLPSGRMLWDTDMNGGKSLFEEFLVMHRKPKQFAAMCNSWRSKYSLQKLDNSRPITAEQVVAFDKLFQRGLLSAARNDTAYIFPDDKGKQNTDDPALMITANVTSEQLIRYLIQHGGNPFEEDVRGASLFHWAAGCGNLNALKELVTATTNSSYWAENSQKYGVQAALLWKASRDDATPLHWAAAGAGPKEFGKYSISILVIAVMTNELIL